MVFQLDELYEYVTAEQRVTFLHTLYNASASEGGRR
jgi:hypothetical protein